MDCVNTRAAYPRCASGLVALPRPGSRRAAGGAGAWFAWVLADRPGSCWPPAPAVPQVTPVPAPPAYRRVSQVWSVRSDKGPPGSPVDADARCGPTRLDNTCPPWRGSTRHPRPARPLQGTRRVSSLEARAYVLCCAVDKGRLWALYVFEAYPLRTEGVGPTGARGVSDGTVQGARSLAKPQDRNHVVLIDTVARHPNSADQG